MSDSGSYTSSNTFTVTDAQFLASRIATELTQVQHGYPGEDPTSDMVINYAVEAALLLHHKLLKKAQYGYKRNGEWIFVLEYSADYLGNVTVNSSPGGVPLGANIAGAQWYTFLARHYDTGHSQEELDTINASIPVSRTFGVEPSYATGGNNETNSFERSGVGLNRSAYWVA